jgi:GTP cyclohydrolase I
MTEMRDLILRNLDESTLAQLSDMASVNQLSPEEQATKLLVSALADYSRRKHLYDTAKRIAAMTPKGVVQTDSVELLREDRDR